MRVAVDDDRTLDSAVALQQTDGERDVVEQTEALAMVVERVVKTPADVAGNPARGRLHGGARGGQRSAGHEPQLLHDAHRPRQLELANLHRGQRVRADLAQKLRSVDE